MKFLIEGWGGAEEARLAALLSRFDGMYVGHGLGRRVDLSDGVPEHSAAEDLADRLVHEKEPDLAVLQRLHMDGRGATHLGVVGDWGFRALWDQSIILLLPDTEAARVLIRHPVHRIMARFREIRIGLSAVPHLAPVLFALDDGLRNWLGETQGDWSAPEAVLFLRLVRDQIDQDWRALTHDIEPILYEEVFRGPDGVAELAQRLTDGAVHLDIAVIRGLSGAPVPWLNPSAPSARRVLSTWPYHWSALFEDRIERAGLRMPYADLDYWIPGN